MGCTYREHKPIYSLAVDFGNVQSTGNNLYKKMGEAMVFPVLPFIIPTLWENPHMKMNNSHFPVVVNGF